MRSIIKLFSIIAIVYFLILHYIHKDKVETNALDILTDGRVKTKVLVIFPHPDDETMMSGGLINKLAKDARFEVRVVLLTRGEKGDELRPDLSENELGELRSIEFARAMKKLSVKDFEIFNLGDGKLEGSHELKKSIEAEIIGFQANIVLTFEKTGAYGHIDHVVTSKVVNELSQVNKYNFKSLYATLPRSIEDRLGLQKKMRGDVKLIGNTYSSKPEFKIEIYQNILNKYLAARQYQSQNLSHYMPLFLTIFLMPYEYYTFNWHDEQATNL